MAAPGETLAVTCSSAGTAKRINAEIQRRRNPRMAGPSAPLRGHTVAFVGDTVATRRNHAQLRTDAGVAVRNRHTWTVSAVGRDGSLTVADPARGRVKLPADYVSRHVELGWAVTGYGTQGITTDHGICMVERSSSRAGVYVGMTRGRQRNLALVVDSSGKADARPLLAEIIARPAHSLTAHMARDHLHRAKGLEPPSLGLEAPKVAVESPKLRREPPAPAIDDAARMARRLAEASERLKREHRGPSRSL